MLKDLFAKMKKNAAAASEHSKTHCGGCGHDCNLDDAGCGVGKEASARKKAKAAKLAAKAEKLATKAAKTEAPAEKAETSTGRKGKQGKF